MERRGGLTGLQERNVYWEPSRTECKPSSLHLGYLAHLIRQCFPFTGWGITEKWSNVRFVATLWTVTCQVPPSMWFSRQEYWSGMPYPSPGDLPNPGIEPGSLTLQADSLPSEPPGKPLRNLNQGRKHSLGGPECAYWGCGPPTPCSGSACACVLLKTRDTVQRNSSNFYDLFSLLTDCSDQQITGSKAWITSLL